LRFFAFFIVLIAALHSAPIYAAGGGPSTAPERQYWVADYSKILSSVVISNLTHDAKAHEKNTTDQFVTVIVPSLGGWKVEDYARWIGNAWGIGQRGKNNGVLLLISTEDRRVRIEVGSGLHNKLTDAIAQSIIDNEIVPHFKKGEMQEGVIAGHRAIIEALGGTYRDKTWWENLLTIILLPFFLIGRLRGDFSGGGGSFGVGGGGASGSW
jgi:uncharacterized protein